MSEMAGNSMVVECLMALFLQMDITQYGVEPHDHRNYIQTKPLGEMTTEELEEHINKCVEELNRKHEEIQYDSDYENLSYVAGSEEYSVSCTWNNTDWGHIDTTVLPVDISTSEMVKIGTTAVSKNTGREYQGSKVYSPRGIIHCIIKRHTPLIMVSNVMRPQDKKETVPSINWGLTTKSSAVSPEHIENTLYLVGGVSPSQTNRVYSVRAISPTVVRMAPPKIMVSNIVYRNPDELEGSHVTELIMKRSA